MMNRLILPSLLILAASFVVKAQSKEFDWDSYKAWSDETRYSKTYVVNQRHPNASDENPGTQDAPLKSINRAAQLAVAGEQVLIYGGVYRESIHPKNGGNSERNMIKYVAAPGEKVIIKGSKVLMQKWEQRKIYTDVLTDSTLTYTWSRKTWVTTVPDSFFEDNYFPFKLPNILPEEHPLMPWARLVKEISPYTSTRGLLFQNGKRMQQVEDYGDLTRLPGSFWIDADGRTVHVHGFDSGDPNNSVIEVAVKSHLFRPQAMGVNYIHLSGLTFEHCANGFLRTSTGAITALGGHHWIVENNIIRHINSSGLEFGFMAFENADPHPKNKQRSRSEDKGGMIIRNNTIHDCGTAGIRSFIVTDAIVSGNHIYQCGWQDAENYWECSGIKMLLTTRTLVEGNHIHDIQGGNGIWLDWDIRHSRVTKNRIHDIQNIQGGIFIEASHHPNLVDNNFVWNIDGNGIYANDTDYLMVYQNLVANITGNVVHAIVQTDRYLNGRKLTAEENRIFNNIFINGNPMRFSSNTNMFGNNIYVTTMEPTLFDLNKLGENSLHIRAAADFNPEASFFQWNYPGELPLIESLNEVKRDFWNNPKKEKTIAGPFNSLLNESKIILTENSEKP